MFIFDMDISISASVANVLTGLIVVNVAFVYTTGGLRQYHTSCKINVDSKLE